MQTRILITGLNGIIGWNIYQKAKEDHLAFGTYRRPHPLLRTENLIKVDLEDKRALSGALEALRPDYIIHSWAMCDLDLCEQMPEMAEKINVAGALNILEACGNLNTLRKFVYISTDHVFDGERGSYTEEDMPAPKHVYGRTKFEAEKWVRRSGLPYMIVRPGLAIGRSLQGNKGPRDFLFTRIRLGKPTHYFVDEWRSPIAAQDLAAKVVKLTLSRETGIFHVAGSEKISRFDLARHLAEDGGLPLHNIFPRRREEDRWAHIRPRDLSLKSNRLDSL